MGWLDDFFAGVVVESTGVALPQRDTLNFIGSGFTIADDPANDRTNITLAVDPTGTPLATPDTVVRRDGSAAAAFGGLTTPTLTGTSDLALQVADGHVVTVRDADGEAIRVTPDSNGATTIRSAAGVTSLGLLFDLSPVLTATGSLIVLGDDAGSALALKSSAGLTIDLGGSNVLSVEPNFPHLSEIVGAGITDRQWCDQAAIPALSFFLNGAGATSMLFAAGATPSIAQADKVTNSGTGASLTIQAQNETGTGSTGGELILKGGTGTAAHASGGVTLYQGATQIVRAENSSADGANFNNFLNVGVSGGLRGSNLISVATSGDAYYASFSANLQLQAANNSAVIFSSVSAFVPTEALRITLSGAGTTTMQFASTVLPIIKQADLATNGATGSSLTIQAQNATGTTSTGGNIVLNSGTGTSTRGNASLIGNVMFLESTSIQITDLAGPSTALTITPGPTGTTSVVAAASVTAFTMKQADLVTNSGTGAPLTIQAQNETGTTSTGGALTLASGTGTSSAGTLSLNVGATTGIALTPTAVLFGLPTLSIGSGLSSPILQQDTTATNSIVGQTFIVQAQSCSGTGTTGGTLRLEAGSGTTTYGRVVLDANGTRLTANSTGLGLYGTSPVAQASRVGQLTDSTAGTPGSTLASVVGTTYSTDIPTIRNWAASLAQRINAIETAIHNIGLTA